MLLEITDFQIAKGSLFEDLLMIKGPVVHCPPRGQRYKILFKMLLIIVVSLLYFEFIIIQMVLTLNLVSLEKPCKC